MSETPLSQSQIYVSNLPNQVSNDRLKEAFAKFGPISDNFVPQKKRFGFVTFENEADMMKALSMDGQQLDAEAEAEGAEALKVTRAREKPAPPEGEEAKPKKVRKKQPAAKKEPQGKKQLPAKRDPVKKGNKTKAEPRPNGVNVAARKANYLAEIPAKCLLLGYLHRVVEKETESFDASKTKDGFPGLEWLQAALGEAGVHKSLFFKNHTATYSSDGESWTVAVDGLEGDDGAQNFSWKNTDPCPEHAVAYEAMRRDLLNEAKSSMTFDDSEIAVNRAKIFLLNKLSGLGKGGNNKTTVEIVAPAEKSVSIKAQLKAELKTVGLGEAREELSLEEMRAKARATSAKVAASMSEQELAATGAKKQVAASGVRPDSDSEDNGEADFQLGGDDDGCLLGDY